MPSTEGGGWYVAPELSEPIASVMADALGRAAAQLESTVFRGPVDHVSVQMAGDASTLRALATALRRGLDDNRRERSGQ